MKIRVIDLLNMISRGEGVPKKIKYHNVIYTYDTYNYDVGYVNKDKMPYRWFIKEIDVDVYDCLNDEVEIIEDTSKKIERIGRHFSFNYIDKNNKELVFNELDKNLNLLANKIDEIINYLNKGE